MMGFSAVPGNIGGACAAFLQRRALETAVKARKSSFVTAVAIVHHFNSLFFSHCQVNDTAVYWACAVINIYIYFVGVVQVYAIRRLW